MEITILKKPCCLLEQYAQYALVWYGIKTEEFQEFSADLLHEQKEKAMCCVSDFKLIFTNKRFPEKILLLLGQGSALYD